MIPFHEQKAVPNLWSWLIKQYKLHKAGHGDTVIVICGSEQIGKTRFALRLIWCLYKLLSLKDENYSLDNTVFTGKDYRERMTTCTKSIIHLDEAGVCLYSRQAMHPDNVLTNKKLMVCGYRHNVHILCLPDFFSIDSYIKNHRVACIIKIFKNNKFKTWCGNKKIKKILYQKNYAVKSSSRGWWTEKDDTPEFKDFMKQYRKKEHKFKSMSMEETEKDEEKQLNEKDILKRTIYQMHTKGNVATDTIADSMDLSRRTVQRWIKEQTPDDRPNIYIKGVELGNHTPH